MKCGQVREIINVLYVLSEWAKFRVKFKDEAMTKNQWYLICFLTLCLLFIFFLFFNFFNIGYLQADVEIVFTSIGSQIWWRQREAKQQITGPLMGICDTKREFIATPMTPTINYNSNNNNNNTNKIKSGSNIKLLSELKGFSFLILFFFFHCK